MGKRAHGSPRRLDHVDRQSQVGVSGAMRARDVSRPTEDAAAADSENDDGVAADSEGDTAGRRLRDSEAAEGGDTRATR